MAKQISEYTDINALQTLMENAKRYGREDVWNEAFRRKCVLQGEGIDDPLSKGFYEMLAAYEELLSQKNGKRTAASRTRQKLKNKGIVKCLEEWAVGTAPTQGFELLVKNGLYELTGEYLVLRFPEHFSEKAVRSAQLRLEKHGVALEKNIIEKFR